MAIFTILIFAMFYVQKIHEQNLYQKKLDRVISQVNEQKAQIESLDEALISMNKHSDYLETRIGQMEKLDTLIKDLERSFTNK